MSYMSDLKHTLIRDSKFTDSSVLFRKLLPLYGLQKSIAIIRKWAIIWVNYKEGMTGKGLKGRTLNGRIMCH